jgi:transposase
MPLFYDLYEGNRNDAKEFPLILQRFNAFLGELCAKGCGPADITLIFDKGNNSASNFTLIDGLGLHFVGSAKLDEHKELASISNDDVRFASCDEAGLEGTKAFRVEKALYGKERIVVVSYNQNLFNAQWLTLQNDLHKAMEQLGALRQKLLDRAAGLIKRGQAPTVQSVQKQCDSILSRQHMKQIIKVEIREGLLDTAQLDYTIDSAVLTELTDTHLGKNLIITDRTAWNDTRIIQAYRSQFIIENVFKEMKDRKSGTWWPLNHWTDSKIKIHGLYCTIALLLRALMWRRIAKAQVRLSMNRLLSELDDIREVVNIYPKKHGQKIARRQSVLSRTSELQDKLIAILRLKEDANGVLG